MISRYFSSDSIWIPCHFVVMVILVEVGAAPPLFATTAGFVLGSIVSCLFLYLSLVLAENALQIIGFRYVGYVSVGALVNGWLFHVIHDLWQPHYLLTQALASVLLVLAVYVTRVHSLMPIVQERTH